MAGIGPDYSVVVQSVVEIHGLGNGIVRNHGKALEHDVFQKSKFRLFYLLYLIITKIPNLV
jgi:hypothetical protein